MFLFDCFGARFGRHRRGAVSVEYAVVIGTLAVAIIAAFAGLTSKIIVALSNLVF